MSDLHDHMSGTRRLFLSINDNMSNEKITPIVMCLVLSVIFTDAK